jgi:hypothetical protein
LSALTLQCPPLARRTPFHRHLPHYQAHQLPSHSHFLLLSYHTHGPHPNPGSGNRDMPRLSAVGFNTWAMRLTTALPMYAPRSWRCHPRASPPEPDPHDTARRRNFGYTGALTAAKLSARSSRRCALVGLRTPAWPALPPVHYFQRILDGTPTHLPSRTRPTRPHGCTGLRDKRYEVPFKLKQRVLTIPLCPAFDQHRQNNKAVLRGLRAKVYSAEPHIKGQICPRKPYWA